jgi:ABC-2 type transport system permease protein
MKYFAFLTNAFSEALIYRANTFFILLSRFLEIGLYFFLWSAVFQNRSEIGEYDLSQMVTYYLIAGLMITVIQGFDISALVGNDLWEGKLNIYLVKPMSYFRMILFYSLGKLIYNLVFFLIFLIPILFIFKDFLSLEINLLNLVLFVYFLAVGFFIFLLISFIVGLTVVWLGAHWGFNHAVRILINFLGGSVIPITLFPEKFLKLIEILPFKFLIYVPIEIIIGSNQMQAEIFSNILLSLIWILVLYLLSKLVYQKALNNYEAIGI